MTKEKIGKIVAKARAKKKVSFYRLQKDAKIQRAQVLAIERGSVADNYTVDSLLAVCNTLGVTIHAEFNG